MSSPTCSAENPGKSTRLANQPLASRLRLSCNINDISAGLYGLPVRPTCGSAGLDADSAQIQNSIFHQVTLTGRETYCFFAALTTTTSTNLHAELDAGRAMQTIGVPHLVTAQLALTCSGYAPCCPKSKRSPCAQNQGNHPGDDKC